MGSRSGFVNERAAGAPSLRVYMNLDSVADLRCDSQWGGQQGAACYQRLLGDGFDGVQLTTDDLPLTSSPLPHCGLDRINTPAEADAIVTKHALRGDVCFTVHAGWGLEDDDESFRLVEAILTASERYRLPVFIEWKQYQFAPSSGPRQRRLSRPLQGPLDSCNARFSKERYPR